MGLFEIVVGNVPEPMAVILDQNNMSIMKIKSLLSGTLRFFLKWRKMSKLYFVGPDL